MNKKQKFIINSTALSSIALIACYVGYQYYTSQLPQESSSQKDFISETQEESFTQAILHTLNIPAYNESNDAYLLHNLKDHSNQSISLAEEPLIQTHHEEMPTTRTKKKESKKMYHEQHAKTHHDTHTHTATPIKSIKKNRYDNSGFSTTIQDFFSSAHPTVAPTATQKAKREISDIINFTFHSQTFVAGGTNIELLNSSNIFDNYFFTQALLDSCVYMRSPESNWRPLDFMLNLRFNTIWGNNGETNHTEQDIVKIGIAAIETPHSHVIDRPLLWLRQGWLKISSEQDENNFVQFGFFPKKIGLGVTLGNAYKIGRTIPGNWSEQYVDQFRPAIRWNGQISDNHDVRFEIYGAWNNFTSTSFDSQASYVNAQQLQQADTPPFIKSMPQRSRFDNNYIISGELDFSALQNETETNKFRIKPYLIYNHNPSQTVEFYNDAESKLGILGVHLLGKKEQFTCEFEFAINVGAQEVKAWDRNSWEQNKTVIQTHLFIREYTEPFNAGVPANEQGAWTLSSDSPENPYQEFAYPNGGEFQNSNPDFFVPTTTGTVININHLFKNSYNRFRKAYKNNYKGFMLLGDLAYDFNDTWKLGIATGYTSGDQNPNDYKEKVFLNRLNNQWNTISQDHDHNYNGFIGIESMYLGKSARAFFLLETQKLNRPLTQGPYMTTPELTNLMYLGLGLHYNKSWENKHITIRPNAFIFAQPHALTFGYDPVLYDSWFTYNVATDPDTAPFFPNINQTLRTGLGTEFNLMVDFYAGDSIKFYGFASVFIPGSYYKDIEKYSYNNLGKVIPLDEQIKIEAPDFTGDLQRSHQRVTLLDSPSALVNIGLVYTFDLYPEWFEKKILKNKRKR